ncbi:MAG: 50S ribosomal protein L10 [Oscillospiraceae bacterium]|nr:50S ribosomal protein L10 [Oscillospiraceae bacterium]
MPSDKVLSQKIEKVKIFSNKFANAVAGVFVDYKGINVQDDTQLRVELQQAGVDYFVAKNTLLAFAAKAAGINGLEEIFKGPTAVAISSTDYVTAAKIISKYSKNLTNKFNIKAGFADGKVIDVKTVGIFADLPSKEELVTMLLRGFNAPITGLVIVLNANISGLVIALSAVATKKTRA